MEPNEIDNDAKSEMHVVAETEEGTEAAQDIDAAELEAEVAAREAGSQSDPELIEEEDAMAAEATRSANGEAEAEPAKPEKAEKPAKPPKSTEAKSIIEDAPNYKETDVFAWANNLVQFKDEIKIELFFFNKNGVVYRTNLAAELGKQLEPIFIDEILEYVLEGADNGLIVRSFEDAESEDNVLMRTRLGKVDKAREMLNWLKTQEHEIELFNEEEHDIKRIKGIVARGSHRDLPQKFYVIKQLPQSQVMKGSSGWMIRDNKMVQFDADAALRVPTDNQLLVLDQDMYVFSQAKLKALFGYDAKEASIADKKVEEIQQNFKLSFTEGEDINSLIKGNRQVIKKLQKLDPTLVKQDDVIDRSDELGIGLMSDDNGAIIIMDGKDMTKFVNLINEDYMESPLTGIRYEIQKKRELKISEDDENEGLLREIS